jgi:hypothetical protein
MKNLVRVLAFLGVLSGFAASAGAQFDSAAKKPVCPLQGQYAFLFSGTPSGPAETGGYQFSQVGEFTVSSSGLVTGGTMDQLDGSFDTWSTSTITGGSCANGTNGLNTLTLDVNGYPFVSFAFVVTKAGNVRFIEFDSGGVGAGIIRKQDKTAFSLSKLSGDWAFGLDAFGAGSGRAIGRLTISPPRGSTASITNGVLELQGYVSSSTALQSGSFLGPLSTTTGRGTATWFDTVAVGGTSPDSLVFYVVSADEMFLLDTNTTFGALAGSVGEQLRQVGAGTFGVSSLSSAMVLSLSAGTFYVGGTDILVAQEKADGHGNISGEYDENDNGAVSSAYYNSGSYSVNPDGTGSLTFSGAATRQFYLALISQNTAYVLEIPQPSQYTSTFGQLEPQSRLLPVAGTYANATTPSSGSNDYLASETTLNPTTHAMTSWSDVSLLYYDSAFCDLYTVLQSEVKTSGPYGISNGRVTLWIDGPTAGYVISPSKFVAIQPVISGPGGAALTRFEQ